MTAQQLAHHTTAMAPQNENTAIEAWSPRLEDSKSTFPIPEERLISLAKEVMAKENGVQDPSLLAEDFEFLAPIVGPLSKAKFLKAFEAFNLKKAFPDLEANAHHWRVDPYEAGRVWFTTRTRGTHTGELRFGAKVIKPTNKRVEAAPEAASMTFNAQGQCTKLTVGYVMDRRVGNTGGLGALFGIMFAIGHPLPFPEAKPYTKSWTLWAFERVADFGEWVTGMLSGWRGKGAPLIKDEKAAAVQK